ncbi:MAG TPA: alpha/beta fold hydrolase [Vicinamibacterales bacterium]|nr:alpha/beta fold hydrolase [Candidatus Kryptonia bacterium]HUK34119.1 alpha/beta fold hydrolase [Vicinamibacterales bacterium]
MPSKYTYIDGIAVNYFHTGRTTLPDVAPDLSRGETLLFIHAAGSNANTWNRQLDHFGTQHSPIAFDFPGHGRSGNTEGLRSIAEYRDFSKKCADALQLRRVVVIGRSMGGAIAMEFAIAYPAQVKALVLIATAAKFELSAERVETWRNVMRGRAQQPFTTEAFSPKTDFAVMREAWMEQVKTDPRVRYFDFLACNAFDVTARLGQIKAPTLIIAGRDDGITPVAKSEELHRGIAGSQLVVIDDAGHTVTSEKTAEVNAAIDEFLKGLPE